MTKWDYMTIVLTGGLMGRHKDEPKHEDLVTQCDALGREAWELTWILINESLHGEKDDRVERANSAVHGRFVEPPISEHEASGLGRSKPKCGKRRYGDACALRPARHVVIVELGRQPQKQMHAGGDALHRELRKMLRDRCQHAVSSRPKDSACDAGGGRSDRG
jgi:hypothetical protein